jgi:hypothetical protein
MKDVEKSHYFEDTSLMKIPKQHRITQFVKHKVIADKEVYEELDISDLYNLDIKTKRVTHFEVKKSSDEEFDTSAYRNRVFSDNTPATFRPNTKLIE